MATSLTTGAERAVHGITISNDDPVYVADRANNRIQGSFTLTASQPIRRAHHRLYGGHFVSIA
jgi:hypothetical protein